MDHVVGGGQVQPRAARLQRQEEDGRPVRRLEARHHLVARHVEEVELSWILEDNEGMRNIIESIGGRVSKRYRVYDKDLA